MGYRIRLGEDVSDYALSLIAYYEAGGTDTALDLQAERDFQSSRIGAMERQLCSLPGRTREYEVFMLRVAQNSFRYFTTFEELYAGKMLHGLL